MEIKGVKISKKLAEWMDKRVNIYREPNTFVIIGYGAFNLTAQKIAENTFDEIKRWVERNHGEVELIRNTYPEVEKKTDGHILFKIYSPVCEMVVEEIIEQRNERMRLVAIEHRNREAMEARRR